MTTKHPKNTRTKILHTVIKLVAEGKTGISMSRIAQEVGVTKSALYYFFKNKQELFEEVVFFVFHELTSEVEKIMQQQLDPKNKLQKIIQITVDCFKKDSSITNFSFQRVFQNDPEFLVKIMKMRENFTSCIVILLEEGIKKGIFEQKDTRKSAEIMVGLLDFIALTSALPCPHPKKNIDAHELCFYLLSLFEKKPGHQH